MCACACLCVLWVCEQINDWIKTNVKFWPKQSNCTARFFRHVSVFTFEVHCSFRQKNVSVDTKMWIGRSDVPIRTTNGARCPLSNYSHTNDGDVGRHRVTPTTWWPTWPRGQERAVTTDLKITLFLDQWVSRGRGKCIAKHTWVQGVFLFVCFCFQSVTGDFFFDRRQREREGERRERERCVCVQPIRE